jgi:outer membrane protein OmpA-like peptidoglycan-associated protein
MVVLPFSVQAQNLAGFYVGGAVGANWRQDADVTLSGEAVTGAFGVGTASRSGSVSFDMGYVGMLSLGYGYGNGLRVEFEVSHRGDDVDTVSGMGRQPGWLSAGRTSTTAFMLNALYDFQLGLPVVPYVGIGAGYALSAFDSVRTQSPAGAAPQTNIGGTEGNFAYQGILGVAMPIAAMPGLALTAEYRYFAMLDTDHQVTAYQPVGFSRGSAEVENANHSLLVGFRYTFGAAPAPAPAPAAAPAPARTFLVFFDFARADLTDRARQIIADAASSAQQSGTTRIEIAGHTDTVGSARYNQGLSERRANAVAAELERRGVPRSAMVIQGFGFTRLLVPTAANVREPQNRRVEIVLR